MNPDRKTGVGGVEYAKHARPWLKRRFWKAVRRAAKRALEREAACR